MAKSKKDKISAKIAKLLREEGVTKDQAISMAYATYGDEVPKYQGAGWAVNNSFNRPKALNNFGLPSIPNIFPNSYTSTEQGYEAEIPDYVTQGLGNKHMAENATPPPVETSLNTVSLTPDQLADETTQGQTPSLEMKSRMAQNKYNNTTTNNYDEDGNAVDMGRTPQENNQYFNQYAGFDIPSAAYMFGNSIENGDVAGSVISGLKMGTGLARNIAGGVGAANRRNYILKDAQEKKRQGMIGEYTNYQSGGTFNVPTPMSQEEELEYNSKAVQRPIKHIQEVFTEEYKSNGSLPPGTYQKVYYTDPRDAKVENEDYEYVTLGGFKDLKRMTNYRIYNENKNKPTINKGNDVVSFQDGGEQTQQPSPEEIITAYAQVSQQDPQAIMEQLQQLSPEEQQQALQEMMMALQEQETPQMQEGGEFYLKTLKGKKIKSYELDTKTNKYVVEYE